MSERKKKVYNLRSQLLNKWPWKQRRQLIRRVKRRWMTICRFNWENFWQNTVDTETSPQSNKSSIPQINISISAWLQYCRTETYCKNKSYTNWSAEVIVSFLKLFYMFKITTSNKQLHFCILVFQCTSWLLYRFQIFVLYSSTVRSGRWFVNCLYWNNLLQRGPGQGVSGCDFSSTDATKWSQNTAEVLQAAVFSAPSDEAMKQWRRWTSHHMICIECISRFTLPEVTLHVIASLHWLCNLVTLIAFGLDSPLGCLYSELVRSLTCSAKRRLCPCIC